MQKIVNQAATGQPAVTRIVSIEPFIPRSYHVLLVEMDTTEKHVIVSARCTQPESLLRSLYDQRSQARHCISPDRAYHNSSPLSQKVSRLLLRVQVVRAPSPLCL